MKQAKAGRFGVNTNLAVLGLTRTQSLLPCSMGGAIVGRFLTILYKHAKENWAPQGSSW